MSARGALRRLAFVLLSVTIAAALTAREGTTEETDPAKRVLGLSYRGRHRAYPLEVFFPPRAVNDDIRQQEVVIFHDPARGISSAFFRMVMGEAIEFSGSVDGTVADDLTTITRWDLKSGKAVGGNLAGMELIPLPVVNISLEEWLSRHPDTDIYLRDLP